MNEPDHILSPRRTFLGTLAAGAATLVAGAAAPVAAMAPDAGVLTLQQADAWLGKLHGQYRQFFDAVSFNDGFPLYFPFTWSQTMQATYKPSGADLCPVIGLRHMGIGPAFNDAIWAKYKLGEFFKVNDPKTGKPATRNFMNSEAAGDVRFPGSSLGKQIAGGAVVTVCNVATTVLSGMAADAAGLKMSADAAYKEWVAGLIPGCNLVPSGVLAVHRAQKPGNCTYCYAG